MRARFVIGVASFALCVGPAVAGPIQLAQLRLPPSLMRLPPPDCRIAARLPGGFETFAAFQVAAASAPVSHVRLVVAGSRLAVEPPKTPGRLSLWVKAAGDGPYEPVCLNVRVGEAGRDHVIQATAPARLAGSVWRVELRLDPGMADPAQAMTFAREPGTAQDPEWSQLSEPLTAAEGFLCVGLHDWPQRRAERGFGGRVRLTVNSVDPLRPMPPPQHAALRDTVLNAVELWVQGCAACRADHLAVVEIDGEIYVREGLGRLLSEGRLRADARPAAIETALQEALEPIIRLAAGPELAIPRSKAFAGYVRLENERASTAMCALAPSAAAPTLRAVAAALCRPQTLPQDELATIMLRFRANGVTACGVSPETIGCRADRTLTEYNARDYRFSTGGTGTVIGDGPIELSLLHVVLHEMGHWIGLGHLDAGESIMASSLRQARCIDVPTLEALGRELDVEEAPPAAFTLN